MNKPNKKQEYIKAEKQARTVKVTTIFKTLGVFALLVGAYILGNQTAIQANYTFETATTYKAEQLVEKLTVKQAQ